MLTKADVRLQAQNELLVTFHEAAMEKMYEDKECRTKWNKIHAIFVGLIAIQCDDKLTDAQEQAVLGVLNRISA